MFSFRRYLLFWGLVDFIYVFIDFFLYFLYSSIFELKFDLKHLHHLNFDFIIILMIYLHKDSNTCYYHWNVWWCRFSTSLFIFSNVVAIRYFEIIYHLISDNICTLFVPKKASINYTYLHQLQLIFSFHIIFAWVIYRRHVWQTRASLAYEK